MSETSRGGAEGSIPSIAGGSTVANLMQGGLRVGPLEGTLSARDLIQNHAERENVAAVIGSFVRPPASGDI